VEISGKIGGVASEKLAIWPQEMALEILDMDPLGEEFALRKW